MLTAKHEVYTVATKTQFHQRIKGSLQETEDWWCLVVEDDGTTCVEHEWSHVDPYGKRAPRAGTQRIPVDDFLAGDHDTAAKDNLAELLKKSERG